MTQPETLPATQGQAPKPARQIAMHQGGGIQLRDVQDALQFCKNVVESKIGPVGLDTIQKVFVALESGLELGFSPMQALSAVYVVNGRPSLYGDAALAVIRASGVCDYGPYVFTRGEGDAMEGVMAFKRRDLDSKIESTFSVADAKAAGLWKKSGPWSSYPKDMLQWRAVSRATHKYFSGELKGLPLKEEVDDYRAVETTAYMIPHRPSAPDPLLTLEAPASAEVHEETASSPTSAGAVEAAGQPSLPLSPWTAGDESRCIECKRLRSRIGHLGHEDGCSLGGER